MNYTRRTTRPDGMHYRETRKHVGALRGRRGRHGQGTGVFALIVAALVASLVAFWTFYR